MSTQYTTTGIALAGGGSKSIAYLGVLQALEENQIYPTHISGTSVGSIMGAFYAAGNSPKEILDIVKKMSIRKLVSFRRFYKGLQYSKFTKKLLKTYIKVDKFKDLPKPLYVSVTNMRTGKNEIIQSGNIYNALLASATFPYLFAPLKIGNELYTDGSIYNNLPVNPLIETCDNILAININTCRVQPITNFTSVISAWDRIFSMSIWSHVQQVLKDCDAVIELDMDNYGIWDIKKADELFEYGYKNATAQMEQIKKAICYF